MDRRRRDPGGQRLFGGAGAVTREQLHQLSQAASEAVHAPAVKASAAGSTLVVGADWVSSGPGMVALAGLAFTAMTFAINVWSTYRKERRASEERREAAAINAAKLRRIEAGLPPVATDSDNVPLEDRA